MSGFLSSSPPSQRFTPAVQTGASSSPSHASSYTAAAPSISSSFTNSSAPGLHNNAHDGPHGKDAMRDTVTRRVATLVYLKAVLTGRQAYASVIHLSQRDLQAIYEPERMRKRSHRNLVLGLSLSPLLELQNLQDFIKAVSQVLTDVEALPETAGGSIGLGSFSTGAEKKGVRNLFSNKLKNQKKHLTHEHPTPDALSGGSATGNPSSTVLAHDAALSSSMVSSSSQAAEVASEFPADIGVATDTTLLTAFTSHPAQPFVPDFLQTFLTLCDILIEVYSKILALSGFSAANWDEPIHGHQEEARGMAGQLSESFNRMDTKVKRILSQVSKELDGVARQAAKEELEASL